MSGENSCRILVVDDNEMNRELVRAHLVAEGYAVDLAVDGAEALKSFGASRQDLVLLDVLMPGLDGFETCRRLRELPGGVEAAIAFLSALGGLGSHRQAIDAGGDDFLTKPIARTELLIRVRSLLRIKRYQDELRANYELIRVQRDELVQVQRQREELTAFMVHDFKNPLTAVLGNAEYLVDDPSLPQPAHEAARDVLLAAGDMHRMVLNLLDISRSETGSLTARLAEVDVPTRVGRVCEAMRRRAADNGQRLDVSIGHALSAVRTDPELLDRILENLLDNSLKYTPSGGSIRVEAVRAPGGIELWVRDDGPGIPAAYRERIFEKYARLEQEVGERASRGLGLAFCRLATETLGGRIWVEENTPRGSAFCVRLPAQR